MTVDDIILLCVAVALVLLVSARYWWGTSCRRTKGPWDGHGISASVIKGQLDRVRRNYLSVAHQPANRSGQCRVRLESARRGLERLPYFKRHSAPNEHCPANRIHSHEPEDHPNS